ncbi:MAG: HAD hydrolase-like protein [Candidatus Micrarchaeota archaeon]|nr:HAD hydrolase-like protein [Candidatus Micrarchaeota archaeon]
MMRGLIFDFSRTIYDKESEKLMKGAEKMLDFLSKRYRLALISSGGGRKKRELISSIGLDKYFMAILVVEKKTRDDFLKD